MVSSLHTAWVGQWLGRLPRPLLAVLDDWSRRRAMRRAAARRARALARRAASSPAAGR